MTDPAAATEVGGDLVAFLLARIGEDEQAARAATPGPWSVRPEARSAHSMLYGEADVSGPDGRAVAQDRDGGCASTEDAAHIARHDPARVLAEVAAKRRIIELHTGDHECSTYDHNGEIDHCTWVIGDCSTLQLLALPYADHPDYDPSWAIE